MKECLRCKNEFYPSKPKQKFCSAKCKAYYHQDIKKSKTKETSYDVIPSGEVLIKDKDLIKWFIEGVKSMADCGDSVLKKETDEGYEIELGRIKNSNMPHRQKDTAIRKLKEKYPHQLLTRREE